MRGCSFESCGRKHYAKDLCNPHYQQQLAGKDLTPVTYGQGFLNKDGYRIVPGNGHPNSEKSGKVRQHILVMSDALGRPLYRDELTKEEVHHKNGVRHDNRLENLELWAVSQPTGQRVDDLVSWAHQILDRYEH